MISIDQSILKAIEAELDFRAWLSGISKKTGVSYNPNDPLYNYRKVYKLGLEPTWQPEHKQYKWSDIGKSPDYDLLIDHKTGERKR